MSRKLLPWAWAALAVLCVALLPLGRPRSTGAQNAPVYELACPTAMYPNTYLTSNDPTTTQLRANGCVDRIGRLSIAPYPTFWTNEFGTGTSSLGSGNTTTGFTVALPAMNFSQITVNVGTADGSNNYSWGLYNLAGLPVCTVAAGTLGSTGVVTRSCTQGPVSIGQDMYVFALTGAATTAAFSAGFGGNQLFPFNTNVNLGTSSGGAMPAGISIPTINWGVGGGRQWIFGLN